ncbi:cardiolipin synthase [Spiroplasma chrysopicola]|uniref:Cardiolipin synthase n=1 Tax=Spiroplasma chrysopicola DF-1 TaxID=1276227 RepID=R4U4F8_9MOLU|nr:cardiolipin synthase [Spiroplasma chrysopicola]AGM25453.1 cardiolipin synthetase [Spiroplasma chrysopicola DF-1]
MKNWLKIILSMIFLFGLVVLAIVAVAVVFNIQYTFIFLGFILIDFLFSFVIFFSKRRYEVKFSWIIFINFFPIIGLCSYLMFGRKYHYSNQKTLFYEKINKNEYQNNLLTNDKVKKTVGLIPQHFVKTVDLINEIAEKPLYQNNAIEIMENGAKCFQRMLDDLDNAKSYILLNYFIIADGELFEIVCAVLRDRIAAGVQVFMIYDHVGSYFKISKKSIRKLRKIGVIVQKFLPIITPFINGNANYRNHRKDVVIDGLVGYTGGINLADVYANQSAKFGLFHDVQVRIVGKAVRGLEVTFVDDWYFATKHQEKLTELVPAILQTKNYNSQGTAIVQIVSHGPSIDQSVTKDVYLSLINSAQKRIWLSTPYFIPPVELIEALKLAARSGIDVRLIIPGLTDKIFVLDITKTYCRELIEAGVKIFEMNGIFNHNKIAIFDNDVTIIGSCNLDYRSFFADHQTSAIIYDQAVVETFLPRWEWDFQHAIMWQEWPIKYKPLKYRFLLVCLKLFAPIL